MPSKTNPDLKTNISTLHSFDIYAESRQFDFFLLILNTCATRLCSASLRKKKKKSIIPHLESSKNFKSGL